MKTKIAKKNVPERLESFLMTYENFKEIFLSQKKISIYDFNFLKSYLQKFSIFRNKRCRSLATSFIKELERFFDKNKDIFTNENVNYNNSQIITTFKAFEFHLQKFEDYQKIETHVKKR